MKPRRTFAWLLLAAGLFAFIFFYQRHARNVVPAPAMMLPDLKPAAVTTVQVRPLAQREIRVEKTNDAWQLTEPLRYPAQAASIENLLDALVRITPALRITPREFRSRPKAEEEYGLTSPQATIRVEQPDHSAMILVGGKTAPGDQIFLQVVGTEGVYVVDAGLLKFIPNSANDWRDTTLINLNRLAFDRVAVTNGARTFELRRDPTNRLWRLAPPNEGRADNAKVHESLRNLHSLVVQQFVSDDPTKADLETLGLQPPELELALAQGTNPPIRLQFGKSPTNDAAHVYARRLGQNAIVTVAAEFLVPWRGAINDFRDPHLLVVTRPVEVIEVRAQDSFSLVSQTNDGWRVLPQNFPADVTLVMELLSRLTNMDVVQFVKDVTPEPLLPAYGLAPPSRVYILKTASTNASAGLTNEVLAELQFGTNQEENVFARRADETFVYAVKKAAVEQLPDLSWRMRQRQIWDLPEEEVTSVTIRQHGRSRQILYHGQHSWSLAPGSQGSIEDLRVDQTVRGLCHLAASTWVARGAASRAAYGFTDDAWQITLELKGGTKSTLELGRESPSSFPYLAVTLDGDTWIFECPPLLVRDVVSYLGVPNGP